MSSPGRTNANETWDRRLLLAELVASAISGFERAGRLVGANPTPVLPALGDEWDLIAS
jgi:hypothetical protein